MPAPINPTPFVFRLSGGASNTDPDLSIGGAMSNSTPYSNTAAYSAGSMAGVTLKGGHGMASGTGQLRYTAIGATLAWKAPGETVFGIEFQADMSVDGAGQTAYIRSSTEVGELSAELPPSMLAIEIDIASLPVSDTTVDVTIGQTSLELFPPVTDDESKTGIVKYRGLYLLSTYGVVLNMAFLTGNQPAGSGFISVSLAGPPNSTLEALADEYTEPAASDFTYLTDGIVFGGTEGGYLPVWIRQEIPALNETTFTNERVELFMRSGAYWSAIDFLSSVALSKYTLAYFQGAGKTITYAVTLAGTPELVLAPIYFTVTRYAAKYGINDSLSISVPAEGIDAQAIYDRRDNALSVTQTITYENGSSLVTTIDGMTLVNVSSYGSGSNRTILLQGEKTGDYQSGTVHTGLRVSEIEGKLINNGAVTLVVPQVEALAIEPGQSVRVDGIDVLVDSVSVSIRPDSAVARITRLGT